MSKQFYHVDCLPYEEFDTLEEIKQRLLSLPQSTVEHLNIDEEGDCIFQFDEDFFADITATAVWLDKNGKFQFGQTVDCY